MHSIHTYVYLLAVLTLLVIGADDSQYLDTVSVASIPTEISTAREVQISALSEFTWTPVPPEDSRLGELAISVSNEGYTTYTKDVFSEEHDISGREYVSEIIFEHHNDIDIYLFNELNREGFRWKLDFPAYKMSLRGILVDAIDRRVAGYTRRIDKNSIEVLVFNLRSELNSDCLIDGVSLSNVSQFPSCYFGKQYHVFISDLIDLNTIATSFEENS